MEKKGLAHGYTTMKDIDEFNIPLAQLIQKLKEEGSWKPIDKEKDIPVNMFMLSLVHFTTTESDSEEEE